MIQRSEDGAPPSIMLAHGFILDVAVDQTAPSPRILGEKIADALQWIEGCGKVNVSYLGPMEPDEIV